MRTLTQYLLPHRIVNLIANLSANCKITPIKNFLISYFIKRYAVNMREAIQEDPFAYASYNDFFTRKLKPESRPIDQSPGSIVSPADGMIAQIGAINENRILQAKGFDFTVQELLANDNLSEHFSNGNFATIYLAPKDYHRVHMPIDGRLLKMIYVPGKLFSVNTQAAESIPRVFARNERVIALFETVIGTVAVVMVGAMIVGGIETVWAGKISPPHSKTIATAFYTHDPMIELSKGAEMGLFKLGSTVIILFSPGTMAWDQTININQDIKFGHKIGSVNSFK